jgi:hypothetical protein
MTLSSDITRSKEIDIAGLRRDGAPASLKVHEKWDNPAVTEVALEAGGCNSYMGLRQNTYGASDVSIASEVIHRVARGSGSGSSVEAVFDARHGKGQRHTTFKTLGPVLLGITRKIDSATGEPVKGLSGIRALSVGKVGLTRTLGIADRTIPQRAA